MTTNRKKESRCQKIRRTQHSSQRQIPAPILWGWWRGMSLEIYGARREIATTRKGKI